MAFRSPDIWWITTSAVVSYKNLQEDEQAQALWFRNSASPQIYDEGPINSRMNSFDKILPVDGTEELLQLDGDRLDLFRTATGVEDANDLKKHIVAVQRAAYAVSTPHPPPLTAVMLGVRR